MKKLFIILAAIAVIRLGSIAFFETQLLEEPIILAQSIDNDELYISYITNSAQPHEIRDVVINDHHFYPYVETNINGFVTSSNQSSVYVSGRMYSIHSVTFPLHSVEENLDFSTLTTSTIQFENGIQFEEPLTVRSPWVEQTLLESTTSSGSSDGTGNFSFITEQNVVLTNLSFEQFKDVKLSINRIQVELPLKGPITIPNDSLIEITYKAQLGFHLHDQSEIVLSFIDENNFPVDIPVVAYKNNPPTSEWIHQYVKERAKK